MHTRRVSVLIACFNRKGLTLRCLAALFKAGNEHIRISVYLVDDGSDDGTSEAVAAAYPDVNVIRSAGNLYWNRGMLLAWQQALREPCDHFLWLNDDTELRPGSLQELIDVADTYDKRAIVVGRIVDGRTGKIIYGGQSYENRVANIGVGLSVRYRSIGLVTDDREFCDTMNGNCVLIPRVVAEIVGLNDPIYWHATGDTDYGLRATAKGFMVTQLLAPVAVGEFNQEYQRNVSVLTPGNWKYVLFHPKGRRLVEQMHFYRSYARPWWLPRMLYSYAKMLRIR